MSAEERMEKDVHNNAIPVLRPVPGSTKTVASGASTAQSAPVGTAGIYEVVGTADAYIEIGSNPVATTTTQFVAGGIPKFMRLEATDRVAGLQVSSAGVVHITRWA